MRGRPWLAVASRFSVVAALAVAALLASCRRTSDEAGSAATASDGSAELLAVDASSALAPVDAGGLVASTRRACRVMSLRGDATLRLASSVSGRAGGESADAQASRWLAQGEILPEGGIIELGAGSAVTVQATVSTREITLVGPALAEPCPGGDEAVRLSRGKVTAFPGAGVRPGAEVWVATPLGVVRFNDANLEVDVPGSEADRLKIVVVTGQGTFVPAAGVLMGAPLPGRGDESDGGGLRTKATGGAIALSPGFTWEVSRPPGPSSRWARDLVVACIRQGAAAREAGQRVTARGANRASLGDLAAAHVLARQLARAACEGARAAAALPAGQSDAALRAKLDGADENWKAAPPASSARPPASSGVPSPTSSAAN